ncbi:MAG: hypothetical protein I8H71_00455 [Xanthomonadaceae bacterium]|nr:hypothetical protein [Xanthomonadaceae bacterium]MBH2008144.1 hypothetical protein [Xanthomonadaceae bacterium]
MNPFKRWRWWAMLALPVAVIAANSYGPDGWREPMVRLLWLSWTALCVALTHSARKALYDYANGRQAWQKALEDPVGAGLAFLGLCIVTAALFLGLANFARAQPLPAAALRLQVPAAAQQLAPLAVQEIERIWPGIPRRSYLGALVEQETCISLSHRFCWSPTARLKTAREEGAGLGQFTRAWDASGRERFDALTEVRALAPQDLQALNWSTVYERADLGLRAVLVKVRDCDRRLQRLGNIGEMQRLAFCDAAYNGGYGGLQSDRKLCALKTGCDPGQWFGHVEHTSGKSRAKWQGYGKSAFEINREHVDMTVNVRRPKYVQWLGV